LLRPHLERSGSGENLKKGSRTNSRTDRAGKKSSNTHKYPHQKKKKKKKKKKKELTEPGPRWTKGKKKTKRSEEGRRSTMGRGVGETAALGGAYSRKRRSTGQKIVMLTKSV